MRHSLLARACAVLSLTIASVASAEVTVPNVISDHLVLQRDRAVPIWGSAAPGEKVTVKFGSQEKFAVAGADGAWRVALDAMPANATPANMTIAAANTITLNDILIGEVWLGGGQSNMELPMIAPAPGGRGVASQPAALPQIAAALATANLPNIRLFRVEKRLNVEDVATPGWQSCSADSARSFSALMFFFGRELHQELNVPIGLIQSCWGGTRIEPWTPAAAYESDPAFASKATSKPVIIDGARAGTHYNAMIRPLAPYAIKGVLWYQGESNIIATNDGPIYLDKFKTLLTSWRVAFEQADLPFYTVQIAPYYYTRRNDPLKHDAEELPKLWQAQTMALHLPNVGLAGTMDLVEDFSDIHPKNKWDVGHRLALWALNKNYGRSSLIHSGPIYKSVEFRAGRAIVSFYSVGGGLAARDDKPLTHFEVAGGDGAFHPGNAVIEGNTVVVMNPDVADPKAVRFGWTEIAQPNFINKNNLPAIPFNTAGPLMPPK